MKNNFNTQLLHRRRQRKRPARKTASKEVCPQTRDRPLLREKVAQICEIDGDNYSFSFSAVELLSAKA